MLLVASLLFPMRSRGGVTFEQDIPGTLYILAVGIDEYPRGDHGQFVNLGGCKNDVTAIVAALEKKSVPRYVRVDKQVLLDRDATRERVEAAINHIIHESKPDDTVVVYFAGHAYRGGAGTPSGAGDEFFLAMSNANQAGPESGIPGRLLKSWLSRVQAGHQLVIFDASYSDLAVQIFRSHVEEDSKEALELANRSLLVVGYEGPGWEGRDDKGETHGLLTIILARALSGQGDAFPKDGVLWASELQAYVYAGGAEERVRTGSYQHAATWMSGSDFAVLTTDAALASKSRGFAQPAEASPTEAPAPPAPKNYALLIAGDEYDNKSWPQLSNPVFDATSLAQELKEGYDFETQMVTNPTRKDIFAVLKDYQKKTFSDDDELFIFIAGHGYFDEAGGEGYVIARDSAPPGDDLPSTAYPFSSLRTAVDNIHAKHIFLVLDVCFGGTFDERITRATGRGGDDEYQEVSKAEFVQRKMKYKTRRYLTSGGKEYVGDGRPGQHSPFARRLLEAMRSRGGKEGILTMNRLLPYVEKVTPEPRAGEFGHNEPGSDFLFIAGGPQGAPAPPQN